MGYHYVEPFYLQQGLRHQELLMRFDRLLRLVGVILPTSLNEGMILFW